VHILFLGHFYVGDKPGCVWAGSETMAHTMLAYAVSHGHTATVVTTSQDVGCDYDLDGVRVLTRARKDDLSWIAGLKPDVILTHHQETARAAKLALQLKVPCIQILHNERPGTEHYFQWTTDLFVMNTEWVKDSYSRFNRNKLVVHPPVDGSRHKTTPGDLVTLVNLNEHKGSQVLYQLARRMPDVKFLGVEGGHGTQIMAPSDNVEIQRQTSDMKNDVWARTKVLLMPSIYESYGLVGIEAMHSGIPVIAAPTPGLKESLGAAGTFVDRDDLDGWEKAVRDLLKPARWRSQSAKAKKRIRELDNTDELDTFLEYVEALVTDRAGFPAWVRGRQS